MSQMHCTERSWQGRRERERERRCREEWEVGFVRKHKGVDRNSNKAGEAIWDTGALADPVGVIGRWGETPQPD